MQSFYRVKNVMLCCQHPLCIRECMRRVCVRVSPVRYPFAQFDHFAHIFVCFAIELAKFVLQFLISRLPNSKRMNTQAWCIGMTLTCLNLGTLKFKTIIDPGNIQVLVTLLL
jgi:hypothetical protein